MQVEKQNPRVFSRLSSFSRFPRHFLSDSLKDHALALAFKRTLEDSRSSKAYISHSNIKQLLSNTLIFSKAFLVFDVNDSSADHSISLADFKRSLVHMDIHLSDLAATQVHIVFTISFDIVFTIPFDVVFAISFDVVFAISFDIVFAISFDIVLKI